MRYTVDKTISFELDDRNTREVNQYKANVTIAYVHDPSYGADADGHRGVPMTMIDEVTVNSLYCNGTKVLNTTDFEMLEINRLVDELPIEAEEDNED